MNKKLSDGRPALRLHLPVSAVLSILVAGAAPSLHAQTVASTIQTETTNTTRADAVGSSAPMATAAATGTVKTGQMAVGALPKPESTSETPWHPLTDF